MRAADVLERLSACGVRLAREGVALVAIPRAALTDELRALIRDHKPELLEVLAGSPSPVARAICEDQPEPALSPLSGLECISCTNLEMRAEHHMGTRRRYFWRCRKGHELLEGRNYGERVTIAPPECEEAGSFTPWRAGIK